VEIVVLAFREQSGESVNISGEQWENEMRQRVRRVCRWLARPVLLHWVLPYLMVLVAAGTVAQKYLGLYESQRLFFSSFIFWLGPLPLPGGRCAAAVLLLSLLAKLIVASPWRKATAGIFIAHLGVLLLLLGGLITAAFSVEGYVLLEKNNRTAGFFDYHHRELTIQKNNVPIVRLPFARLGKTIRDSRVPFTLTIHTLCHNCTMAMRSGDTPAFHGSARKIMLSPLADYLEEEHNLAGVEFTVSGAGPEADGTYIAFEPMEKQPTFTLGGDTYRISLGREYYSLPFTLQLLDAEKDIYPGTDVPRSYRSTVMLTDGDVQQRAVITMNHPLRYKGYTVYQSSFSGNDRDTKSVSFAVVRNGGRIFPYVASITLCIGLLIHLSFRLPALLRRQLHAD